jgi:hypothetical protein
MTEKNLLFNLLCYFHLIIWIFVIFSFVKKEYAYFNLKYVIPLIYIFHTLPFHLLTKIKYTVEKEDTENKIKEFENNNIIFYNYKKLKNIFNNSFANPLSPQGLIILGSITSSWAIVYDKFIFK